MRAKLLAFLLLAPLTAACVIGGGRPEEAAPAVQAPPEAWEGVACIAVLPPDNQTMDVTFEYRTWYRAVVMTHLQQHGWACTPIADINRALNGWGFNLPGEVSMFTADELAEAFGCDAIFSWAILEASGNNVVLNFALHKRDGTILWASGERPLRLPFNIIDPTDLRPIDRAIGMAVHEALLDFPVRP
ncbi:MAG: hypothetical protein ACYTAF_14520 [Planctomycetota bacterium]|jgi:hypothetical protein